MPTWLDLHRTEQIVHTSEFCRLATEFGYPLHAMDLITAGEEDYAAMKRSTNGGGENSPMLDGEDDYYEMFLAEI